MFTEKNATEKNERLKIKKAQCSAARRGRDGGRNHLAKRSVPSIKFNVCAMTVLTCWWLSTRFFANDFQLFQVKDPCGYCRKDNESIPCIALHEQSLPKPDLGIWANKLRDIAIYYARSQLLQYVATSPLKVKRLSCIRQQDNPQIPIFSHCLRALIEVGIVSMMRPLTSWRGLMANIDTFHLILISPMWNAFMH